MFTHDDIDLSKTVVRVFKDGYASDNTATIEVAFTATNDEINAAVREQIGYGAKVASISRLELRTSCYGMRRPTRYEDEAITWCATQSGATKQLAESISDLQDSYTLVIAEAGPDWQHCEFTKKTLDDMNQMLRQMYTMANSTWASHVRKAMGPDNS